jgi:hypothetical protein
MCGTEIYFVSKNDTPEMADKKAQLLHIPLIAYEAFAYTIFTTKVVCHISINQKSLLVCLLTYLFARLSA